MRTSLTLPRRVLVLGSGALQIGQAGEFDYSGSQALKALREEGVETVLVNPNIATIQTSEELADQIYFVPVEPDFVERVIVEEKIDAILLAFGGQTALNCGLALEASGVLQKHGVRVLGTQCEAIRATEDRQIFAERLAEIGVSTARSRASRSPEEAIAAAREIGFPVILRAGFSLGGKGSAVLRDEAEFRAFVERAFVGVPQVLVEECLSGWKEIEYEIVRDGSGNVITVCNMENVDPMGIHTGESIVVAPSQTLDDADHQLLRDVALKVATHLGIVGECNIQYALDPRSRAYRVIEVNARLSRSSALASKATGYPLAYVAAKIALGYALPDLANSVTKVTSAFFEPALDYIVCKVPRWDFDKFPSVDRRIGTEMKSVGEVMAIGRSFPEALQKALRMLEIGADGFDPAAATGELEQGVAEPSPRRIFSIARGLEKGLSVERIHALSSIDPWFLGEMARIVEARRSLRALGAIDTIDVERLRELKRLGFSDAAIAHETSSTAESVRARRLALGVRPCLAQIDTLAAEYPASTNYLYLTWAGDESDVEPSTRRRILILGSGCYRIGSSVEFDWCGVKAAETCRALGIETILLNCNPETVSTDYDVCDALVFDEISLETVLEIAEILSFESVIVSMGGQRPNTLAIPLVKAGIAILGTSADSIDLAENRRSFSALCDELGIDQPRWVERTAMTEIATAVHDLGGFPVLVRPSYVLSGSAMRVAHSEAELTNYLDAATHVSREHPVVISKFEVHARELEFDGVASNGEIVCWAISEHVEDAGVHSGDATLILPPQRIYVETVRRVRRVAAELARAMNVTGPFNVQMLSKHNEVKVIECNLRASRSFPFVSKALGHDFVEEATRALLGAKPMAKQADPFAIDHVVVKAPMFSFRRLGGVDPILGVEMASTGEVAAFGETPDEALLLAMLGTGFRIPRRGVLLSLGPVGDKYRFTEHARILGRLGLALYATPGTADILRAEGVEVSTLEKDGPGDTWPFAVELLRRGDIDLVINVPRAYDAKGTPDGIKIRRAAVDLEIPLITDLWLARSVVRAMERHDRASLPVRSWEWYLRRSGLRGLDIHRRTRGQGAK